VDDVEARFTTAATVGLPNAGKSTLVNALARWHVAAVTHKANTTRRRIAAVLTERPVQVVFLDSPGLVERSGSVAVRKDGVRAAIEAETALLVVDGAVQRTQKWDQLCHVAEEVAATRDKAGGSKMGLVVNKVDRVDTTRRAHMADFVSRLNAVLKADNIFYVSALKGHGVAHLRDFLLSTAPLGEWMYAEDARAGDPPIVQVEEIVREKIMQRVHDEVPYQCALLTESWATRDDGSLRIVQCIQVSRSSQIPRVVGTDGAAIAWIKHAAQRDLSEALGCPVELVLRVVGK